ncbi:MAG: PIG-L family deacetylase [Acidobacteria bacterium]|nr:PIG-L family deacetylase [Acidobacteriota bacterium]
MPATYRIALFFVSLGLALGLTAVSAVTQPLSDPAGQADLAVALRQLNSTGTFLSVVAHPDDENNALLARLARGDGHRTVLFSLTRGDGGQNEIGPELFDALAVLRTEELAAAHRLDGAEQYFSRAVDFGYSFSVEETFERWGREEALSDIVRMIRTIRPDVISAMSPEGRGGGQHHQASAILAHEAYHAAADPARFPEQIADGLRPWQARKFYFRTGFPFGMGIGPPGFANRRGDPDPALTTIDLAGYDPLLGATWTELGSRARSMHKCQGMSQFVALPAGAAGGRYRLTETAIAGYTGGSGESSLFDGVDTSIGSLARFAGTSPPSRLVDDLAALAMDARDALEGFESDGMSGAREPVLSGLLRTRLMRTALETGVYGLSDEARAAIDFGLTSKERQFERAAVLAHAVRLEVLADDGIVAPGQPIRLRALVANLGDDPVTVQGLRLDGLDGVTGVDACAAALAAGNVQECSLEARIPPDARMTDIHWTHVAGADRYELDPDVPFGLPFRPTPFRATVDLRLGSASISVERRVEYRYYGDDLFTGEKRMALQVVPRVAVSMTPAITVVPVAATGDAAAREVRVTATHTGPIAPGRPVTGTVRLDLPSGWVSEPASAAVTFGREDESRTVRFRVSTGGAPTGEYTMGAAVDVAGEAYDRGYQVIEYPHTSRRHIGRPAMATVHVLDVAVAPNLLVGYIEGVGDAVPPAIEQLGARVEFIDADGLAWGDLERFDVIVTGVRAYERRDDLRANNNRLLEYVEAGGTVIVQYNKFEFNEAQYGPWPAQVGRGRVTDERAPIRILANDHPVFAWPNRVGAATWENWVQERGLYFLADRDERYADLVELEDTFEYNAGVKRGALVEARPGQGRWVYLGLGLWRQLPAGTPGAYTLLANLLSLGEGDLR